METDLSMLRNENKYSFQLVLVNVYNFIETFSALIPQYYTTVSYVTQINPALIKAIY